MKSGRGDRGRANFFGFGSPRRRDTGSRLTFPAVQSEGGTYLFVLIARQLGAVWAPAQVRTLNRDPAILAALSGPARPAQQKQTMRQIQPKTLASSGWTHGVTAGPINGELFTTYVEKVLTPNLGKGDIVVLDKLGSHKGKAAWAAIRAVGGHMFFLPPYSPDLNPSEQVFAKLKHVMRKAQARAFEETWKTVGKTLDAFAPEECANYLRNSGYVSV